MVEPQFYDFRISSVFLVISDKQLVNEMLAAMLGRNYAERVKIDENGCWIWLGAHLDSGRGRMWYQGKIWTVYRLIYKLLKKPLNHEKVIDHLCNNPKCINPDHLEQVTQKENALRSKTALPAINARKKVCLNGHDLEDENNLFDRKDGSRDCKKCHLVRDRINRLKKKLQREVLVSC